MDDDFEFDFSDYTDILDDDVSQIGTDPTTGGGTGSIDWSSLLKNFGGATKDFAGFAKALLNPKGDLGGLPLLALAALGNKSGFLNAPVTRVGFQGTIPKYTFERQQTPLDQQRPVRYEAITPKEGEMAPAVMRSVPYRPGQGGITYFTPSRFMPLVAPPASGGTTDGTTDNTPGGGSGTLPQSDSGIGSVVTPTTPSGAGSTPFSGPDYTKYGFDQPLINYLQDQYNKSTFDAGIGWSYDPTTQTFSGGTMAGPQTATLAEMQNRAKGYTPQAINPNRVDLPSFAMSNIPDRSEAVDAAAGGYMPGGIAMFASGGRMVGGLEMLAKGRYLKGNGDGVSDSIPAEFAGSGQKAMLADGEFVIPARVVSEIGNGSSDAGARKLYAMLDRIEAQAKKAKRGKPSGADRELNKLA